MNFTQGSASRAARTYLIAVIFLGAWGCGSPDRNVLVGSNADGSDGGGRGTTAGGNGGNNASTSGSTNGGSASTGGATGSNTSGDSSTTGGATNGGTTSTAAGSTVTTGGSSGGPSNSSAGSATTGGDAMADAVGPSTPDAKADAARDAAPDAQRDAIADAVPEASPDARLDAVSEARPDAVVDARADAVDAGANSGPDAAMDSGTCVNIAPFATASSSGGGATSSKIGPEALNDGNLVCGPLDTVGGWHWVFSSTVPSGDYIEYDWPSAQTVAMFHIDTVNSASGCSYQGTQVVQVGRSLAGATVQSWSGAAWVTAGTISGKTDDFDYVLPSPVSTTRLRLYDVLSTSINTAAIVEWQVYGQAGCVSPLDP